MELVEDIYKELDNHGVANLPLVVGGIIPQEDEQVLRSRGVSDVFTPKDIDMNAIMVRMVDIIRERHGLDSAA